MDIQKLDDILKKVTTFAKYEEYRSNLKAVLAHRLFTNPVTNKSVARYVWDLDQMNFN